MGPNCPEQLDSGNSGAQESESIVTCLRLKLPLGTTISNSERKRSVRSATGSVTPDHRFQAPEGWSVGLDVMAAFRGVSQHIFELPQTQSVVRRCHHNPAI
jgi:hypothetical protein